MSLIKFKRGKRAIIEETEIEDGAILFATDTGHILIDYIDEEKKSQRIDTKAPPEGYLYVLKEEESNTVNGDIVFSDDITIAGDLFVSGTTTTINTDTLKVKDNLIVANSDGDLTQGGFAIMTSETDAYGILYVPGSNGTEDGGIKIGLGTVNNDGVFTYAQDEAQFLATRDNIIINGNLVQWDNSAKKLVDTGEKIGDFAKTADIEDGTIVAALADGAYKDSDNNVIVDTYATKSELETGMLVPLTSTHADEADFAFFDSLGNEIVATYAKADDIKNGVIIPNLAATAQALLNSTIEEWVFTLEDGITVTKKVVVMTE